MKNTGLQESMKKDQDQAYIDAELTTNFSNFFDCFSLYLSVSYGLLAVILSLVLYEYIQNESPGAET
jgi:hypothetical protein